MEMHQVRYFLAVAEELNFTRAAERCNVAQPSLTRAIKLLEAEFGGPLFHRERANTHLSELGRMVQPHLQQMAEQTEAAKRLAKDFGKLEKVKLRLGVMCTIAPGPLIHLFVTVQERYPGVELEIFDDSADNLHDKLLSGDLEVAIYCRPNQTEDDRIHAMPLFREQMMIAVGPAHRLAQGNAVAVKDLDGERYLQRINCEFIGQAPEFAAQGVHNIPVHRCEREDWLLAMVEAGAGYAFLPEHSVPSYAKVVSRPLVMPEFWRTVSLVTVRGRPHSPAVGALVREAMATRWFGEKAIAAAQAEADGGDPEEAGEDRAGA